MDTKALGNWLREHNIPVPVSLKQMPQSIYDKIMAGASAAGAIPEAWKAQIKIGGRIVAPVAQSIIVLDKIGSNEFSKKEYFGFDFVPLIEQ